MVSAMRVFGQLGWNYLLKAQSFFFCYLSNWIDWSLLKFYFVKQNIAISHSPVHGRRQRLVVWLGAVCGNLVSRRGMAVSATTSQGQRSMAGHLDPSQVGCELCDGVECACCLLGRVLHPSQWEEGHRISGGKR